jgi:hypothetical protein
MVSSELGHVQTKPRTRRISSDDSFTPIADEKINQINTVAMGQFLTQACAARL